MELMTVKKLSPEQGLEIEQSKFVRFFDRGGIRHVIIHEPKDNRTNYSRDKQQHHAHDIVRRARANSLVDKALAKPYRQKTERHAPSP